MGKTALAREAAHWWRRTRRFEAALFHSFEQGVGAEGAVQTIGERLGGEGFASLGPDEQWAEAVRLFRRHRVLVVWDNFESVLPAFAAPHGGCGRDAVADPGDVQCADAERAPGPLCGPMPPPTVRTTHPALSAPRPPVRTADPTRTCNDSTAT